MKIHFIGIGGIGVSALAQYYLAKGAVVTGSDLEHSEITEMLESKGAKISIGANRAENITQDLDLVVHSPAVNKSNPELTAAYLLKLKTLSYPEALGEISRDYFTIAVSGAHGKSTTASMIALILLKNGLNPTIILGTKLKELEDSNFHAGDSNYLVIEADEYKGSFLNYYPNIIVLTNIEEEHLDYYGKLENILQAFKEYICHLPSDGVLVFNKDDQNIAKLKFEDENFKKVSFSKNDKEVSEIKNTLQVPGLHNAMNALAAFRAARCLNISSQDILKALSEYKGAWRRFEIKEINLNNKAITLVSDYGHHPTEIRATLSAAREKYTDKRIFVVFQPHQYQRTHFLFDKLVSSLEEAAVDKIILAPIYDVAGRENPEIKIQVSSEQLAQALGEKALYIKDFREIERYLRENVEQGDVVIVMGAGDIYSLVKMLST